jgi:hypothetical protein
VTLLALDSILNCIDGAGELHQHAVNYQLDNPAVMLSAEGLQDLLMSGL